MQSALSEFLASLGICPQEVTHPPVHTVRDAYAHYAGLQGLHTKNLFLKDARGSLFLVTLPAERQVDMKALAPMLGARRLSFGSPDLMREVLATEPGSLGPLSLIADRKRQVRFAIDAELLDADAITCHPLDNTRTWVVATDDLRRILQAWHVEPLVLVFDGSPEQPVFV
ncbi:DNA-binding protein [Neoasaia chiangmaiensis NBRC 101099]|uniref:YbaK/aminoacyl-tRNA synthetase-associated domain-containing protein n=1 Tax=Neoasaia chiangmaiensis TaxID=320497 RepID=A0A1U9KN72_9PROT|nr:prolyl-tRNA synthetase associated domain-containing protein [Neoasaia chiangmaiensis]AQS87239.1 hypothetical protein A0U93_03980 [Neoasaia chiangmaiensis]GBR38420.1 DNA-binding protein [Neoasaia chiangmaiensis NBRC 101099]GEN15903.1 DNA-binding protein [Neoasaia chiangmaiensis]